MKKSQTYRVAGFRFIVEGAMPPAANLTPFLTDSEEGELLFTLHIVDSLPLTPSTPFFTTDDGPGYPEISIEQYPDGEWLFKTKPHPGQPITGKFRSNRGFTEAWLVFANEQKEFTLNNTLMLLFAFSSAHKGLLEMHASVIMNEGKGYLFLGKSGTGKSTHSSLWLKHIPGSELLNDDNPILRLMPDGSARVYGSPWSGKTPCYKAQDVPAGAVVRIRQAPFNQIQRETVILAYASLMSSASGFRPFNGLADGWHHTLEGLAAILPCYILDCLPNQEAAELCHKTVTNG